jgi:adenylyltransferase/sulfurtransferase
MVLEQSEISRYARHLNLPGIGMKGQEKLKNGSVLIVGCGGLGVPAMQYLAAAGLGRIGLIDGDSVDVSNLQRQVIYKSDEQGQKKATLAAQKLAALNPEIEIEVYDEFLSVHNALRIIENYDIVVDATDNIPARYLINDACVILAKAMVYGSVYRYEGLVSVFNALSGEKRGPDYRDLYPDPPHPESVPSCEEGGVLGVLPGIIGSIQALEVIKMIVGLPGVLSGKLLLFDALTTQTRIINVRKLEKRKEIKGLIDYEEFCNPALETEVNELEPHELQKMIEEGADIQLIDVREKYEYDLGNIGGISMPLSDFENQMLRLKSNSRIVFYCRKGERSKKAISMALKSFPMQNLYHLKGGILEWKKQINPELSVV